MTRLRLFPLLALAAGLLVAAGGTSAQQPPRLKLVQPKVVQAPPKNAGAAELPAIPKSAGAFISVKLSDIVDHPDLKPVFEQLRKTPEALDGVTELLGVQPQEIERVTLFWPVVSPRGPGDPVLVVTTREPYNEARVLKALGAEPAFDGGLDGGSRWGVGAAGGVRITPRSATKSAIPATEASPPLPPGAEKAVPPAGGSSAPPPAKNPGDDPDGTVPISTAAPTDPLFYAVRSGGFDWLFLADERTLVFVAGGRSDSAMIPLLAQFLQRKQTGPLADAIAAAGNHTLAAGLYLPPLFREFNRGVPRELAPYAALTAARTGTVTGDLGKTAKLTLTLAFDDATAARRAAPVLEEGLKSLAEKATAEVAAMKQRRSAERAIAPLVEMAAAGLKKASVQADGNAVTATTELDVGPAAATAAADLLKSLQSRKKFVARTNNLKQIGLALHSYFDANQRLPANVYGPNGEPLLSWRVHLLPYLEQAALYQQFNMKEAWDGPTNKKLIEQMPKVFEELDRDAPKGQTYYQAFLTADPRKVPPAKIGGPPPFTGRSWLVEGDNRGQSLLVPDGTSNTIALVEARNAVIWSKPDDIRFGERLPPLGEERSDKFMALMLDGSVRGFPTDIKPDTLRLLIDGYDGMPIPDVFDEDRPRAFRGAAGAGNARVAKVEATVRGEEARRAEAATDAAGAGPEVARARVELAEADLARVTELFKNGFAAAAEVDRARAALEEARAAAEKQGAGLEPAKSPTGKK